MIRSINIKGTLLDFSEPRIMGILNVTPDSFSDGGKYNTVDNALKRAEEMLLAGAHIIDVGGYSSRPGADDVSIEQELERTMPVIEKLVEDLSPIISIDTFRSKVAEEAVKAGAAIVNDISAGDDDEKMIETVARLRYRTLPCTKKVHPEQCRNIQNMKMYLVKFLNIY